MTSAGGETGEAEPPSALAASASRVESLLEELLAEIKRSRRWLRFMPWLTVAQLLIGAPAFFISGVVAYSTFVQADATRKMQEASAWPELQIGRSFNSSESVTPEGATPSLAITVANNGIGPARIQDVRVLLDGDVVKTWSDLLNRMELEPGYSNSFVNGATMPSGAFHNALKVDGEVKARALRDAWDERRIIMQICYCSVFDECWTRVSGRRDPRPVETCSAASAASFEQ